MLEPFETYLATRLSAGVARTYALAIERYRAAVIDSEDAGYAEVVAYVGTLRKGGLSHSAVAGHVSALRHYYAYLVAAGERADDPTAAMAVRTRGRPGKLVAADELYAPAQLTAWLAGIPGDAPVHRRVAASLLVYQALAPGEACALRVDAVDLAAGTLRAAGTASIEARTLPLRASQVMLIDGYLRGERARAVADGPRGRWRRRSGAAGGGGPPLQLVVTANGRSLLRQHLVHLVNGRSQKDGSPRGPDYLLPSRIRQSVIAALLGAGHDVRLVQAFAGHRYTSTTEAYRTGALEDLAQAIWRLHPRQ